jgi:hypothetical protein
MRRLLGLLIASFFLVIAAPAHAGWFRAEAIDGPAEIDALGDLDVARDGTGGVVYVKRDNGVAQVFLSRLRGGAWTPPERVSSGAFVTEAAISATDGGRLAIAWIAGGEVAGTVVEGTGAPAPPVVIGGPGASGVAIDMGVNEAAYAVWSQGGDVRAARLAGTIWTAVGAPLDIDPARPAGGGSSRPRVGVSAEGNAVVTWGEEGADGRNHVHARRLTGLTLSAFPQDLTLNDFGGEPAGTADSPDIDIEDDGSFAWVAFRQDIGGRSRSVARRLRGTHYEAPEAIDGGATSTAPRVDFNGRGQGAAVVQASDNAVFSSYLDVFDRFNPGVRVDALAGAVPPEPVVATSERADPYVAWRVGGADGSGSVQARRRNGNRAFERETTISNPDFGAVAQGTLGIGSDRSGNTPVAMLQGAPGARRLAIAAYDRLPGRPVVRDSTVPRPRRPTISWLAGSERWGVQRFTVYVDGKRVGATTRTRLRVRKRLRPGRHSYYVTATDRRGQVARSRTRSFRVGRR